MNPLKPLYAAAAMAALLLLCPLAAQAKVHVVGFGAAKVVPYSSTGDPASALAKGVASGAEEKTLKIRALIVDGQMKEWTTGEAHDVTDRSFTVRRALHINDTLPGERVQRWVWQRGPWLLVDRSTGRVTALHLPDYDPALSEVVWFRDYAAYCGLTASGKQLYAVVAQIAARKPIVARKLSAWAVDDHPTPACDLAAWQREPLRVTFKPTGAAEVSFDVVGLSAILVEDDDADQ